MTATPDTATRVAELLADAREVHSQALERLAAGDIRDAAEKAWCATKRATDALVLARTGTEPERSSETSRGLSGLATADQAVRPLRRRYYSRQAELHGACFYDGICEPVDEVERRIRETAAYIDDAAALVDGSH